MLGLLNLLCLTTVIRKPRYDREFWQLLQPRHSSSQMTHSPILQHVLVMNASRCYIGSEFTTFYFQPLSCLWIWSWDFTPCQLECLAPRHDRFCVWALWCWSTLSCSCGLVLLGSKATVKRSTWPHSISSYPSFPSTQLFQMCVGNCHGAGSSCHSGENSGARVLSPFLVALICLGHLSQCLSTYKCGSDFCSMQACLLHCHLTSLYSIGQDLPGSDLLVVSYSE